MIFVTFTITLEQFYDRFRRSRLQVMGDPDCCEIRRRMY